MEYVVKMRSLGDEMVAAGGQLDGVELMEYIVIGLDDHDFNPIVSALIARTESVCVSELHAQVLAFETRIDLCGGSNSGSSANMANWGGWGMQLIVVMGRGNIMAKYQEELRCSTQVHSASVFTGSTIPFFIVITKYIYVLK